MIALALAAAVLFGAPASRVQILAKHVASVPASVKVKGKVVNGFRWKDDKGEFLAVVTETGPVETKTAKCIGDDGCNDAEIHAYAWAVKSDSLSPLWQVNDQERDCAFDLSVGLVDSAVFLDDKDDNGEAEFSMVYQLTCTSDVSASSLKLIQYQGARKSAIRGTTYPEGIGECAECGQMNVDKAFLEGDKRILDVATKRFKVYTRR